MPARTIMCRCCSRPMATPPTAAASRALAALANLSDQGWLPVTNNNAMSRGSPDASLSAGLRKLHAALAARHRGHRLDRRVDLLRDAGQQPEEAQGCRGPRQGGLRRDVGGARWRLLP